MSEDNNPQVILKGRYQVVPRTIIFIIKDDRVLLQKAPETKKIFPCKFNGIGGHIERLEDVHTAARRELREETGLECVNLILTGTIMIDVSPNEGILLFVYSGNAISGKLSESKEGTLHWLKIDQIDNYDCVEDIPDLINWIRECRRTGRKFSGKYSYSNEGKRLTSIIWEECSP